LLPVLDLGGALAALSAQLWHGGQLRCGGLDAQLRDDARLGEDHAAEH